MVPYERKWILVLTTVSAILLLVNALLQMKREAHLKLIVPAAQTAK